MASADTPAASKPATSKKASPSGKTGTKKPRRSLLGKKIGMTQVYSEAGHWVPVTVLKVGPCTVLQVKTEEKDGYSAVQIGFDDTSKKKKLPQQAYLDRAGILAKKFVREVPFVSESELLPKAPRAAPKATATPSIKVEEKVAETERDAKDVANQGDAKKEEKNAAKGKKKPKKPLADLDPRVGAQVGVSIFKDVPRVDVRGFSKGRGFSGVIRRHHFNAGPKSHGTKNIREPKSTGMHTDPGRVHKGKRMPGHLGAAFRKARNLDVIKVDLEDNLLLVKGSVPGPNGAYVYIQESLK